MQFSLVTDLHHSPDGGTEGQPQEVNVLLGHAVPLVQRPQLGEVGQDAVHLVHVRHHADQELRKHIFSIYIWQLSVLFD